MRTTAPKFAALAAVLALVVALLATGSDAYTLEYKTKKLRTVHRESNILNLDGTTYDVLTESPRNYSIVVVFTAMAPHIGCNGCHTFDPEYKAVAYSWTQANPEHPLHFASLDFAVGREAFGRMNLNSAPNAFLFPATTGPHAIKSISDPHVNYNLPQKYGYAGSDMLSWLSKTLGEKERPPDYTKYFYAGMVAVAAAVFGKYVIKALFFVLTHRKLWAMISLGTILLFTSGTMWNRIRNPPFVAQNHDGIQYISPAFQQQNGIETQISALLHGSAALAVIALTVGVPKVPSAAGQRLLTVALAVALVLVYSIVIRIFLIKNGGYPLRLL